MTPTKPDRARPQATRRIRRFPPRSLTARILAINALALIILAVGLLYLDRHQDDLFDAKIEALTSEGTLVANALGESVVRHDDPDAPLVLDAEAARALVGRLVAPTGTRARLYGSDAELIVDSRTVAGAAPLVETEELPEPSRPGGFVRAIVGAYNWVADRLPPRTDVPAYHDDPLDHAAYWRAREGGSGSAVEETESGEIVITVAVPVQHFKQIQGVLLLNADAEDIEQKVRSARVAILQAFGIAFGITTLLSLYLAGTIARPVRRLARAAERVRAGAGRKAGIPDFTRRGDEIGELSGALREMTDALWGRMDAVERFAADVAHEIKNPLASVRGAIEALERVDDEGQRERLTAIILDDVRRLDRLISDISDASRVDAELSRAEAAPVDLNGMVQMLAEVYRTTRAEQKPRNAPTLVFQPGAEQPCVVPGLEDRLVQVFQNLIANAESFGPPDGQIRIAIEPAPDAVRVIVEDDGPGIPVGQETRIFERFYTVRPEDEKFGIHSGLGLSISKQIVEAHGGRIDAENRADEDGNATGARFVVELPR